MSQPSWEVSKFSHIQHSSVRHTLDMVWITFIFSYTSVNIYVSTFTKSQHPAIPHTFCPSCWCYRCYIQVLYVIIYLYRWYTLNMHYFIIYLLCYLSCLVRNTSLVKCILYTYCIHDKYFIKLILNRRTLLSRTLHHRKTLAT